MKQCRCGFRIALLQRIQKQKTLFRSFLQIFQIVKPAERGCLPHELADQRTQITIPRIIRDELVHCRICFQRKGDAPFFRGIAYFLFQDVDCGNGNFMEREPQGGGFQLGAAEKQ